MDLCSACAVKTAGKLKCCVLELFQELNDYARDDILKLLLIVLVDLPEVFKLICWKYHSLDFLLPIVTILRSLCELHLNLCVRSLPREHLLRLQHLHELAVVTHDKGTLTLSILVVDHTH